MKDILLPPALGRLKRGQLLVNEFFHSIQGESTHAGRPCFFIRLTGCHLRCMWCDSEHSFFEGEVKTVDECVARAAESGSTLVEVTGGEPLLQKSVPDLLKRLCDASHEVLIETSGALPIDGLDPRVKRIVDWKCPGSGMEEWNDPRVLASLRAQDELKLVIRDREDYEWARARLADALGAVDPAVPVHFSPVSGVLPAADLARWIIEDRLQVRLNLQIHKWIWGPDTRGV